MKRLIFTLLCLAVLGTATGCYVDPTLSGSSSVEVGVGAYVEEPVYRDYYPRRYSHIPPNLVVKPRRRHGSS